MKVKTVLGIFLFAIFLSACNGTETPSDSSLTIYTSIYPIQFIAEEIAGEDADVTSIFPPGVDAHTYEPTSKEITEIAKGDAFIYLGAGMESFAESAADALRSQDVHFAEIGKHENLFRKDDGHEGTHGDEHDDGDFDPHIWLDPLRMIEMGDIIKDELIELNSDDKEAYNENFNLFKEKMLTLDEQFINTLESKANKHIIVSHAAYGYWEERYGIKQIPISGLSSNDEPSQKELADIARLAEREKLGYVIFETSGSNRLATIIQEHIDAEKLTIHNLEVLTEDDIAAEETYLSLMEKNLEALDIATH